MLTSKQIVLTTYSNLETQIFDRLLNSLVVEYWLQVRDNNNNLNYILQRLRNIMLVGTDVCVQMVFVWEETGVPGGNPPVCEWNV